MILTAHQPVYLPWLGLFHKIASADEFVFFSEVQYVPKDWISRNRIKTPQGPIWLTVPVLTTGHRDMTIQEMEINNQVPWQRKHWKSILTNYRKAEYFDPYAAFFEETYSRPWRYLADLDEYILRWLLDTLGIATRFHKMSDFQFQGRKSDLVLDMCVQLRASTYIFGAQGRDYADEAAFEAERVHVRFQDYRHPVYPQLHGPFVPNLSVIDLLFNCGPTSLEVLLSGQEPILG